MTAALTETVSGRTIPRYRGEPVTHEVRWYGVRSGETSYRPDAIVAECEPCRAQYTLDGGHTTAELNEFARQHAGTEDEER